MEAVVGGVKIKYVHGFKDRHGHQRYYFRRHGKSVALPGAPGSREFQDAYSAAVGEAPAPPINRAPILRGSFRELSHAYYASPSFLKLSPTTRRNYRRVIEKFCEEYGNKSVQGMSKSDVDRVIGALADKPGAAIVLLKRMRTLLNYAMKLEWIDRNPTTQADTFRSQEIHTWTEDEITQFEAFWPVGSKQRLGFALHLYTGQRGSDVHRMTWADVRGDSIRVVQKKTGAKLVIILHPALQSVLAAWPRSNVAIITTERGRSFSSNGWKNFMSSAIRRAGLPERCKAHGLRKAAARRLAEAGCSASQIAALTGHKTLAEVERYTRAADQEKLNRQAIQKQVENAGVATPIVWLATPQKGH